AAPRADPHGDDAEVVDHLTTADALRVQPRRVAALHPAVVDVEVGDADGVGVAVGQLEGQPPLARLVDQGHAHYSSMITSAVPVSTSAPPTTTRLMSHVATRPRSVSSIAVTVPCARTRSPASTLPRKRTWNDSSRSRPPAHLASIVCR